VAAAASPADAEAEDASQPADLPQADRWHPWADQEPVDQDLGLFGTLGADDG